MQEDKLEVVQDWHEAPPDPQKSYGDSTMSAEETFIEIKPSTHKHYFIRKNTERIGCSYCTNEWVASELHMKVEGGKITQILGQAIPEPIYEFI